jgi:hypothetical protein
MKIILRSCAIAIGMIVCLSKAETLQYKFPESSELVYNVSIQGKVEWAYLNESPSTFDVKGNFLLSLLNLGEKGNITQLKITARNSRIVANQEVLEDTTNSNTQVSNFIPVMLLQIGPNGRIYKSSYLKTALFDFVPFLNFFPVLPDKLITGTRWQQTIPSFNFPAAKMPELVFTYVYEGKSGGLDKIRFLSNQTIRETRTEKDTTIKVNGRNTSDGSILFDAARGTISQAKGNLDIQTYFVFLVPDPESGKKTIPVPLNLKIKLAFSFDRK